mmetsp:Transcript_63937/g.99610  ORF Transcript_63937/g.99610 Transcript_63937/m.99610 type:complete len:802 (-) Transcript_63937:223-2628(-)
MLSRASCSRTFVAAYAACLLTCCQAQLGGGRGKKGFGTKSEGWANGKGGKGPGSRGAPPDKSYTACEGKSSGDTCSWENDRGNMMYGMCKGPPPHMQTEDTRLHCPPKRGQGPGGTNPVQGTNGQGPDVDGPGKRSNSSLEACRDKAAEEECTFRPPVFGDQEAEGWKKEVGRRLQGGKSHFRNNDKKPNWKGRRGPPKGGRRERPGICVPMTQTDGETSATVHFCRALPPTQATDACNESAADDNCSFLIDGADTYVSLQTMTGEQDFAETNGDILASFFVHGEWTDPEVFIEGGSAQGETNSKVFVLPGWPMKVSLTTWSNDGWCFWKILVNDTIILEDPAGPSGSDAYAQETDTVTFKDSRYWIEGPPSSQMFDVPESVGWVAGSTVPFSMHTAATEGAGTTGSVYVSFLVDKTWTEQQAVFTGANSGDVKSIVVTLASWPDKIWIGTDSSDPYSYEKITINQQIVIEDPSGFGGNDKDFEEIVALDSEEAQTFWIASPPSSQTFQIPRRAGLPEERNEKIHKIWGTCQETWWDVLNGTLHCRPSKKKWTPRLSNWKHQGNKSKPNAMQPDFVIKSDAETADPITVQMTINGLDYNQLLQDTSAKNALIEKTKALVAEGAGDGVYPKYVTVTFSPGSVVANCEINPPAYVSRSYVQTQLESATTIPTQLASYVTSTASLSALTTGTVSVSSPTITIIYTVAPASSGGNDDDDDRLVPILIAVAAGAVACAFITSFIAICMWRKKAKSMSPQINGTTVAVGRPVQPGSNDEAAPGIPVVAETEKGKSNPSNEANPKIVL